MSTKRIVITGGPGTGKSSIINELTKQGYACFEEISRNIILEAQKQGIDQLFLADPLLFSERLLEGRKQQYNSALHSNANPVFFDRGVPDIIAYMDFKNEDFPPYFVETCNECVYDYVFILKPWKEIHTTDNERYESFELTTQIHDHLSTTYKKFGYELCDVPFGTVESRTDFILKTLNII